MNYNTAPGGQSPMHHQQGGLPARKQGRGNETQCEALTQETEHYQHRRSSLPKGWNTTKLNVPAL